MTTAQPTPTSPVRLVLPYPPSTNRYWRNYRGRMVRSEEAMRYWFEARAWVRDCGAEWQLAEYLRSEYTLAVTLDLYRPQRSGDLDNRIKVVLDTLQGVAYKNDSQIVRIVANRYDDKHNPRVEVTLCAIEAGYP